MKVSIVNHQSFPGPVIYGSLEWDTAQENSTYGEDVKVRLLVSLLQHGTSAVLRATAGRAYATLLKYGSPTYGHRVQTCHDIRIVKDTLGRPVLRMPDATGLSISFAHLRRKTWAAVSHEGRRVGIDAAWSAEFGGKYPFHRAFQKEEFDYFVGKTGGNREESAAFLWSAKEAAVKSLGCGFRLVDPLCLSVGPLDRSRGENTYGVTLVGPARKRFPCMGEEPIPVRAVHDRGVWISLAIIDTVRSSLMDQVLECIA